MSNIIIYTNSFYFENRLFSFRKKQLFDITNIPTLIPFNEKCNCWIISRRQLTKSKAKELTTYIEIIKDVSNLQWYRQIELNHVFNL